MVKTERKIGMVELAWQALYHINTQTEKNSVEFSELVNYGVAVVHAFKQIGIEATLQNFKEGMECIKENISFVVENRDGAVYISFVPTIQVDEILVDEMFDDSEALTYLEIKKEQNEEVLLQKERLGN